MFIQKIFQFTSWARFYDKKFGDTKMIRHNLFSEARDQLGDCDNCCRRGISKNWEGRGNISLAFAFWMLPLESRWILIHLTFSSDLVPLLHCKLLALESSDWKIYCLCTSPDAASASWARSHSASFSPSCKTEMTLLQWLSFKYGL